MNAILRWAGSKRQLIPKLEKFWPGSQARYIEPFCGSACLFFALEPTRAILGDVNSELMGAYRMLQADAEAVIKALRRMKRSANEYYRVRAQTPNDLDPPQRAARFLFLNRHCFNGIYRTNAVGRFNVPYGPQKHDTPIDEEALRAAATLLKNVRLIAGDFSATLSQVRKGDFVYLDPPYVVRKRRVFREYHPDSFGESDLDTLGLWLKKLDDRGARFVVSYGDSREARILLQKWNSRRVRARRNVAGFAGHRRCAYELVATNIKGGTHAE